jgi:hypothetical protein
MLMRLTFEPVILLVLLVLAACSGVSVTPNSTNPGYIGNNGPGSNGWMSGSGVSSVTVREVRQLIERAARIAVICQPTSRPAWVG